MGYDSWKTTEPSDLDDEEDLLMNGREIDLEYQERVMSDLLDAVAEFLRFSTVRELWKLIAEQL